MDKKHGAKIVKRQKSPSASFSIEEPGSGSASISAGWQLQSHLILGDQGIDFDKIEINFVRFQINFVEIEISFVSIRNIFCQIRSHFLESHFRQIKNDFREKRIQLST